MVYVHFSRPSNNAKLNEVQSKLGLKKGNVLNNAIQDGYVAIKIASQW